MNIIKNYFFVLLLFAGCAGREPFEADPWVPYDESALVMESQENPSQRLRFNFIQSKILDKNDIWKRLVPQLAGFSEEKYEELKPLILEQDIPFIQQRIGDGDFTYEELTQWYLFRILKFENDSNLTLHTIISINPNAVDRARDLDRSRAGKSHPIYGMPVLVKDNIGVEGMPTTAGAAVFSNNNTENAFIIDRIEEKGGIILGKVNLSEWANFICVRCPNGQSTVGGQTLNPYGRYQFDTGGSSAGSGTSMAANYAVAAIGTETSGSILSPSSSNSIVGLKPTVGLLSRSGIVPISSTLDTPGPMTRSVVDNAILLSAMSGKDENDPSMVETIPNKDYISEIKGGSLDGKRFAVLKPFLEDSLYRINVAIIDSLGGELVEIEPDRIGLPGFLSLLRGDMKRDLPKYISQYGSDSISVKNVSGIVEYNRRDTLVRIPYGQGIFEAIVQEAISDESLDSLRSALNQLGKSYFKGFEEQKIDFYISINNWSAGYAAVAKYPCLTIPMGYRENGVPVGITFIAESYEEMELLKVGYAYEKATNSREIPKNYQ